MILSLLLAAWMHAKPTQDDFTSRTFTDQVVTRADYLGPSYSHADTCTNTERRACYDGCRTKPDRPKGASYCFDAECTAIVFEPDDENQGPPSRVLQCRCMWLGIRALLNFP